MTLSRRQLLGDLIWTGSALSLLGLGGCGAPPSTALIRSLQQTLPGSVLGDFRRQSVAPVSFDLVDDRRQLFAQLQAQVDPPLRSPWNPLNVLQGSDPPAWISLLGADWLPRAWAEELIQPLTESEVEPIWDRLPRRWRWSARRSGGQIWGVPWRWGLTAIAYNRRWVREPIQDWSDLWEPQVRGKLTLPDHPREVIGLTLKRLGRLYDTRLREEDPELREALAELQDQVLTYTSTNYLPMLRTEDAWVVVGWTEDLWPLQDNFPDIQVVIPSSGTAVWWDAWVKPALQEESLERERSELISAWLQQVLDPELTARIVDTSRIASAVPVDPQQLSPQVQGRPDLDPQIWERAEIWEPLSFDQAQLYLQWWQRMRFEQLRT